MDAAPNSPDSAEARRYNQIKRWLGFADIDTGFVFLVVLLVTGWSSRLSDLALGPGEDRNYYFAIALYVFSLLAISKVVGFGLEFFALRLERRYHLSDKCLRASLWDYIK